MNLVLFGDSVFDNGAYVRQGEAVIDVLRESLPPGQEARLLARDGAVITGVLAQLRAIPATVTHIFISIGGNDALGGLSVLSERASSVADALSRILPFRNRFATAYRSMLDAVGGKRLPTALCTIYDSRLPDLDQREIANLALGLLNDVITREAVSRRLPVIDLRLLFDDPSDCANAIEPSGQGSRKIASAMRQIVESHDFGGPARFYSKK